MALLEEIHAPSHGSPFSNGDRLMILHLNTTGNAFSNTDSDFLFRIFFWRLTGVISSMGIYIIPIYAPSLTVFKAWLDGALSSLVEWEVSLPLAWVGIIVSLRSLPTQTFLWIYESDGTKKNQTKTPKKKKKGVTNQKFSFQYCQNETFRTIFHFLLHQKSLKSSQTE